MQFSEEALGRRVQYITLVNIQGAKEITYKFNKQGVTRIFAKNETGKSILTKAMQFFTLGQAGQKDIRESILRDDTDTSAILISLYNGRQVIFVYKNSIPMYIIRDKDGKLTTFHTDTPPKEVIDELGYHVDINEEICLNIRESEPLPLVHTSDRTNSAILNCVLENPAVDRTIRNVEVRMEKLKQTKSLCDLYTSSYNAALKSIIIPTETDEELDRKIAQIRYYKGIVQAYSKYTDGIKELNMIVSTIKSTNIKTVNVEKITNLIKIHNTEVDSKLLNIVNIVTVMRNANTHLLNKDINSIRNDIRMHRLYSHYNTNENEILNILNNIDKSKYSVENHNKLIDLNKKINAAKIGIKAMETVIDTVSTILEPRKCSIDANKIRNLIKQDKVLSKYMYNASNISVKTTVLSQCEFRGDTRVLEKKISNYELGKKYLNSFSFIERIEELYNKLDKYNELSSRIDELKTTCKVCPLCGTAFKEGDKCYV
ncbi:hypothetical protein [Clostridium tertium]|uniref:hypothetical protein n=1 Tax=Clostridium tertium TaxID=1559 RepID=UPI0023B25BB8|nr:hypothetical protein [Clostridium tertium]